LGGDCGAIELRNIARFHRGAHGGNFRELSTNRYIVEIAEHNWFRELGKDFGFVIERCRHGWWPLRNFAVAFSLLKRQALLFHVHVFTGASAR